MQERRNGQYLNEIVLLGDKEFIIEYGSGIDISLSPASSPPSSPLPSASSSSPTGPSAFGAAPPSLAPIIEVARGARCNCYGVSEFSAHLHGTHLETRQHILPHPRPAVEFLEGFRFIARVVTVAPRPAHSMPLSLVGAPDDLIIARADLERAVAADSVTPEALVIRTPNFRGKQGKNYGGTNPPYPHHLIAGWCVERGISHIVLDLPSADREEGELFFHRTFWNDGKDAAGKTIPGLEHLSGTPRDFATITEFAFIPDTVADGWYILILAPIGFPGDAAPVRPLLLPLSPR